MSPHPVKEQLKSYAEQIEKFLGCCLQDSAMPDSLRTAMEYSLLAGGKRLRPALCLAWAEMLGTQRTAVLPFAAAIECIHTYSLIHDDLPAMDDDDLRRGKPSSHKKFGEAMAILAGDGLLTEAFTLVFSTTLPCERVQTAGLELSRAAGARGMVGGQVLDMAYTRQEEITLEMLQAMHGRKTGALITASCTCGALLAGAGNKELEQARTYGEQIGLAFQVVDDILDVTGTQEDLGKPIGSDQEQGKSTYPKLIGLERSYQFSRQCADAAVEQVSIFDSRTGRFLGDLARYIVDRIN
ncbi:MAG: polyprenyl synthetase family protein [Desulfovibrionales bacterium]